MEFMVEDQRHFRVKEMTEAGFSSICCCVVAKLTAVLIVVFSSQQCQKYGKFAPPCGNI